MCLITLRYVMCHTIRPLQITLFTQMSCALVATINFQTFSSPKKEISYLFTVTPHVPWLSGPGSRFLSL